MDYAKHFSQRLTDASVLLEQTIATVKEESALLGNVPGHINSLRKTVDPTCPSLDPPYTESYVLGYWNNAKVALGAHVSGLVATATQNQVNQAARLDRALTKFEEALRNLPI